MEGRWRARREWRWQRCRSCLPRCADIEAGTRCGIWRCGARRRETWGLGKDVMPARRGRPAMRLRLLFTNIPAPEEKAPKDGGERLPPASGSRVLKLANGRCGEGEEIHSILKRDLSGGMMPSGKFGANACWWELAALSHNLVALLRVCALGEGWLRVRMKRLRGGVLPGGGSGGAACPAGEAGDRGGRGWSRSGGRWRAWRRSRAAAEPVRRLFRRAHSLPVRPVSPGLV